jgi:hypothetical protein
MHFPEFALFTGTRTSFCGLKSQLMETKWKVKKNVPDFACVNILFLDLRYRLTDVP